MDINRHEIKGRLLVDPRIVETKYGSVAILVVATLSRRFIGQTIDVSETRHIVIVTGDLVDSVSFARSEQVVWVFGEAIDRETTTNGVTTLTRQIIASEIEVCATGRHKPNLHTQNGFRTSNVRSIKQVNKSRKKGVRIDHHGGDVLAAATDDSSSLDEYFDSMQGDSETRIETLNDISHSLSTIETGGDVVDARVSESVIERREDEPSAAVRSASAMRTNEPVEAINPFASLSEQLICHYGALRNER